MFNKLALKINYMCYNTSLCVFFSEYAVGNFTEEMVTTSTPKPSTSDPIVIDLVPHSESGGGKVENSKGQGGKGQGQDGGEEVNGRGEKKGMLGNNPSYGK